VLWQREFRLRTKIQLDTLKVIGSVGEPINEEAWHWYNDHVDKRCPVVDTWWQTETGGIMISIPFVTLLNQRMLLPLPGIQPVLMDEKEMK
jgi:acetyl-CoA synthetase